MKLGVGMSRTDRLCYLRGLETQRRPAVENLVLKQGGRLVEGRIHSLTIALEDPSAAL